jgi:hypothetical protein
MYKFCCLQVNFVNVTGWNWSKFGEIWKFQWLKLILKQENMYIFGISVDFCNQKKCHIDISGNFKFWLSYENFQSSKPTDLKKKVRRNYFYILLQLFKGHSGTLNYGTIEIVTVLAALGCKKVLFSYNKITLILKKEIAFICSKYFFTETQ